MNARPTIATYNADEPLVGYRNYAVNIAGDVPQFVSSFNGETTPPGETLVAICKRRYQATPPCPCGRCGIYGYVKPHRWRVHARHRCLTAFGLTAFFGTVAIGRFGCGGEVRAQFARPLALELRSRTDEPPLGAAEALAASYEIPVVAIAHGEAVDVDELRALAEVAA